MANIKDITKEEIEAFAGVMRGDSMDTIIDRQEKNGQQKVVKNILLPKKANKYHYISEKNVKEKYEQLGIKIINEYDDLFYKAVLPDGWKIITKGSCYWNYIINGKKEEVADFFYKAAFYDRDAFVNFKEGK